MRTLKQCQQAFSATGFLTSESWGRSSTPGKINQEITEIKSCLNSLNGEQHLTLESSLKPSLRWYATTTNQQIYVCSDDISPDSPEIP